MYTPAFPVSLVDLGDHTRVTRTHRDCMEMFLHPAERKVVWDAAAAELFAGRGCVREQSVCEQRACLHSAQGTGR